MAGETISSRPARKNYFLLTSPFIEPVQVWIPLSGRTRALICGVRDRCPRLEYRLAPSPHQCGFDHLMVSLTGTPETLRQDKERRLGNLEQELLAAAKGRKIELPIADIRRKGLISTLRERGRR